MPNDPYLIESGHDKPRNPGTIEVGSFGVGLASPAEEEESDDEPLEGGKEPEIE